MRIAVHNRMRIVALCLVSLITCGAVRVRESLWERHKASLHRVAAEVAVAPEGQDSLLGWPLLPPLQPLSNRRVHSQLHVQAHAASQSQLQPRMRSHRHSSGGTVFQQQERLRRDAISQLKEAAAAAKKHKEAKLKSKLKHIRMEKAATVLQGTLQQMAAASRSIANKADRVREHAAHMAKRAKQLKARRDAAAKMAIHLDKEVGVDKNQLANAQRTAAKFVERTKKVAKMRVSKADEEAEEMVKRAKAKAKALKEHVRQEATAAMAQAAHQASELEADARGELVSAKRKQHAATVSAETSKESFEEAEAATWTMMEKTQEEKNKEVLAEAATEQAQRSMQRAVSQVKAFEAKNAALLGRRSDE